MKKSKYRIRNWSQYNRALIQRGDITVWISEDAIAGWRDSEKTGKRGRPRIYSDIAISAALTIRSVFHLPLRALQGFLQSIIVLIGAGLPIPSYTQISRRSATLGKFLKRLSKKKITDLVIDSTGLKVYGEGEWKVRQHGVGKRRTWRKLHLAVCPHSHEIVAEVLTKNSTADCEVYPELLSLVPKSVKCVYVDGAYDTNGCYQASAEKGITPVVPPQRNAVFHPNAPPHMKVRNDACLAILGLGNDEVARQLWKKLAGYHRRSLAETAMFRFKQLFGDRLASREFRRQEVEVRIKCEAINRMNSLGLPRSQRIVA